MVTADDVRACATVDGVAALFRKLGYAARPQRIRLEEWRRSAKVPQVAEGDDLWKIGTSGAVTIWALEPRGARPHAARRFLSDLQRSDRLGTHVVFDMSGNPVTVHGVGFDGAIRRVDVDVNDPAGGDLDFFASLDVRDESDDPQKLFERAINRERVTRRFFLRFRRAVEDASTELRIQFPDEPEGEISGQALLILSRVLFLYFVQEKRWLDGDRRYLWRLVNRHRSRESMYRSLFVPLFFGCLNTPRAERSSRARALGSIPYLNGGLFYPSPFEERHESIDLSNAFVRGMIEDLFERFRFSLVEDDESHSAVDPEMLGRVFESLMEENRRAATGSFYTPRTIVRRMTAEALAEWLSDGDAALAKRLQRVCTGEAERISDEEGVRLLARLDTLRLLDPACGSGAFLLTALHTLEHLYRVLCAACGATPPEPLRRHIVEERLYGVDVSADAVRLCELRLWLALVAVLPDETHLVPPLPNLDRNVMQGNSLLSPLDYLATGRGDAYHAWARALAERRALVERYRSAPPKERPQVARALRSSDVAIASEILDRAIASDRAELARLAPDTLFPVGDRKSKDTLHLEQRVREAEEEREKLRRGELSFFAYDVHFAHVIADGGFGVVIGNPPWVRMSRLEMRERRMLADRYRWFGYRTRGRFSQSDLSLAFLERSLQLGAPRSLVTMLLPAKLANAGFAMPARRELAASHGIVSIRDWTDVAEARFEADAFPMSLTLRTGGEPVHVRVEADGQPFDIEQAALADRTPDAPWLLIAPDVRSVVDRMRELHPPLVERLGRSPVMGVKTGANGVFLSNDVEIRADAVVCDGIEIPRSAVCRVVRGRDVERWRCSDSCWMIIPPRDARRCAWARSLAEKRGLELSAFRLAYFRPEHLGIKVVWKDLSRFMQAAVLPATVSIAGGEFAVVPNQTVYMLDAASQEEAFTLCAILNSAVFNGLVMAGAERAKDRHRRFFASTVGSVPFPAIDRRSDEVRTLASLGRRAHRDSTALVKIDGIVRELYGLTSAEARTLGALQG